MCERRLCRKLAFIIGLCVCSAKDKLYTVQNTESKHIGCFCLYTSIGQHFYDTNIKAIDKLSDEDPAAFLLHLQGQWETFVAFLFYTDQEVHVLRSIQPILTNCLSWRSFLTLIEGQCNTHNFSDFLTKYVFINFVLAITGHRCNQNSRCQHQAQQAYPLARQSINPYSHGSICRSLILCTAVNRLYNNK